ncbi:TLD-domain-containing protein [Cubamyces menziesii]|uniref:Oxidation resistance protein 1 n=1 Tax=Trametes cubensis TaxID=1111947 RepID=A0AAD7TMQ8_9APHY|nr:TLD-domain-containing protein [Cubamyces menziesii]KAJ8469856.1 hypothetical protein ONZ51_g8706 [Trametes cubensis]
MVSSLLTSTIWPSAWSRTTLSASASASTSTSRSHNDDLSTDRLSLVVAAAASHLVGLSRPALQSRAAIISGSFAEGFEHGDHARHPALQASSFTGDRQLHKGFQYDKAHAERKGVRLVGRKEMTTPILTVEIADMLRPFFLALARLPRPWTLLYSLDQHGISLNTLYARCQDSKDSALFIVLGANNAVFGAWMGEGMHSSKDAYYDTGESSVFFLAVLYWMTEPDIDTLNRFLWQLVGKDRVRVFKWADKNDYVALCESDYISFGRGDGHYGLWLNETLSDGLWARCPAFDNEPLYSAGVRQDETVILNCVELEVWALVES